MQYYSKNKSNLSICFILTNSAVWESRNFNMFNFLPSKIKTCPYLEQA